MNNAPVISNFNAAAATYDDAADLQKIVGKRLVASLGEIHPKNILDIGCGTGIVTAMAAQKWPMARITALDASDDMLMRVKEKIPAVHIIKADAASVPLLPEYDLILSSMMLHWLHDPYSTLRRWKSFLGAKGVLVVAVPVEGSLDEWDAMCQSNGIESRLWPFPRAEALKEFGNVRIERVGITHPSLRAFLESLRLTGAKTPHPTRTQTSIPLLRRLLRKRTGAFNVSFTIAYLQIQ